MKRYVANVISMIADRACILLTEEQAIDVINDSGYADEILEHDGDTIYDTAPRESLIGAMCEKITGRQAWSNGEIMKDIEGYEKWIESFIQLATEKGYIIVEN